MFVDPPAPIYLVNGLGGNYDKDEDISTMSENPMEWMVKMTDRLGYGRLTIWNSTHLHYE
jgi:hypothetical protein